MAVKPQRQSGTSRISPSKAIPAKSAAKASSISPQTAKTLVEKAAIAKPHVALVP